METTVETLVTEIALNQNSQRKKKTTWANRIAVALLGTYLKWIEIAAVDTKTMLYLIVIFPLKDVYLAVDS